MVTRNTSFSDKDQIAMLTSLKANGMLMEADYLESKMMMNAGLTAFENGKLFFGCFGKKCR